MFCSRCGLQTELTTEYYYPSQLKRGGTSWCKFCMAAVNKKNKPKHRERDREYSRQRYKDHKEFLRVQKKAYRTKRKSLYESLKEAEPCKDCGNYFPAICMDYDHLDPVEKSDNVSNLMHANAPWSEIEAEIAKCDLICANCHRIRTRDRFLFEPTTLD